MALPLEGLDKDQLTQKRATRTLNIQLINADTPEKIVQVKLVQQMHAALISAEDALLESLQAEPAAAVKPHWTEGLKLQRRAVTELTELLDKMRMGVELGTEAINKIYHTAGGYDNMSKEQKKLLKKFTEEKEKEEKERERIQKAQQLAAQQQFQWPSGRGRGGYGIPYSYGGYGGGGQSYGGQYGAVD